MADPGFSPGGAPTPKIAIIFHIFAENCMKMKEFGPQGGRASLAPPLGSANAHDQVAMENSTSMLFNSISRSMLSGNFMHFLHFLLYFPFPT